MEIAYRGALPETSGPSFDILYYSNCSAAEWRDCELLSWRREERKVSWDGWLTRKGEKEHLEKLSSVEGARLRVLTVNASNRRL